MLASVQQLDRMEKEVGALRTDVRKAWEDLVEQIGDLEEWPACHLIGGTDDIFSPHLKRHTRFKGTLFVLCNFVNPRTWATWLLERGSLKDEAACKDVAGILHAQMTGKHWKVSTSLRLARKFTNDKPEKERKHTWDGVGDIGSFQPHRAIVPRPPFDVDPGLKDYWDQAIAMLLGRSKYAVPLRGPQADKWTELLHDPDEDPDESYLRLDELRLDEQELAARAGRYAHNLTLATA